MIVSVCKIQKRKFYRLMIDFRLLNANSMYAGSSRFTCRDEQGNVRNLSISPEDSTFAFFLHRYISIAQNGERRQN